MEWITRRRRPSGVACRRRCVPDAYLTGRGPVRYTVEDTSQLKQSRCVASTLPERTSSCSVRVINVSSRSIRRATHFEQMKRGANAERKLRTVCMRATFLLEQQQPRNDTSCDTRTGVSRIAHMHAPPQLETVQQPAAFRMPCQQRLFGPVESHFAIPRLYPWPPPSSLSTVRVGSDGCC